MSMKYVYIRKTVDFGVTKKKIFKNRSDLILMGVGRVKSRFIQNLKKTIFYSKNYFSKKLVLQKNVKVRQ